MKSKYGRFTVSFLIAFCWLGLSTAISADWALDVSNHLPVWYVAWVIIGIALLPGFLMSGMFVSNIFNTRLEPVQCQDAGPVCVLICACNEEKTIDLLVSAQGRGADRAQRFGSRLLSAIVPVDPIGGFADRIRAGACAAAHSLEGITKEDIAMKMRKGFRGVFLFGALLTAIVAAMAIILRK